MANTHSINPTITDVESLLTRVGNVETLNALQQGAINLNTAKVGTPFTISGTDVYINSKMIGINNSTPNCSLDIGSGSGTPTIRLSGANNATTSSELIFSDVYASDDASDDYGAGAGIRWNSQDNKLQFLVDNESGTLQDVGHIQRSGTCSWTIPRLLAPTSFSMYSIDQTPKSIFLYASRVKIITSGVSVSPLTIPNSATNVAFLNSIESGIDNAEATGIITISSAGLYKFTLTLTLDQTGSQKDFKIEFNHTDGTRIWRSRDHLSREEGSLSYSLISVNTFKYLAVGTYRFVFECDEDGSGRIVNTSTSATTLMIEKMVLPNGYTLSSSYPAA